MSPRKPHSNRPLPTGRRPSRPSKPSIRPQWQRSRLSASGASAHTADDLAQQLDGGTSLAAAELDLDERAQREIQKISGCLIRFRDSKHQERFNYQTNGYVVIPETVITDARRAEINTALAKIDSDVKTLATKAKAQPRAQSGTYFAKNLGAPNYFSDAVASYEFVIAKRRPFAEACGKEPPAPPSTMPLSQVPDTPFGRYGVCASLYWQFKLPFDPNFDAAVVLMRAAKQPDFYNCTARPPSRCFPGQTWGKLLEEAAQDLAASPTRPGTYEELYSRFSRGQSPLAAAFNRYIKMRVSYEPLLCQAGQTKDCIAPNLVAQADQIGT